MSFAKGSCLMAALCVAWCGFAQTSSVASQQSSGPPSAAPPSSPAKVEMPSDPAALLALAAKMNGLQNVGTEPLHVKATYQLLDDSGAVKETGRFEELYVSAKKYKLSYSSPSFNQTDYSTETGLFRLGDRRWADDSVAVSHSVLYPNFPSSETIGKSKIGIEERSAGPAKLKCVTLKTLQPESPGSTAVYCFNQFAPILRIFNTSRGDDQTVYTTIGSALGAYFARDATFSELGKERVRVHLDLLDAVPHLDEAVLIPPAEAVKIPRRVTVSGALMSEKIIRKVAPEYPSVAKGSGVQGTVAFQAVIGTGGKVADLKTVSGPPLLVQAAADAVRQWIYERYSIDSEPVEVVTRINVVFTLGVTPLGRIW